jgi:hypothetical protein
MFRTLPLGNTPSRPFKATGEPRNSAELGLYVAQHVRNTQYHYRDAVENGMDPKTAWHKHVTQPLLQSLDAKYHPTALQHLRSHASTFMD